MPVRIRLNTILLPLITVLALCGVAAAIILIAPDVHYEANWQNKSVSEIYESKISYGGWIPYLGGTATRNLIIGLIGASGISSLLAMATVPEDDFKAVAMSKIYYVLASNLCVAFSLLLFSYSIFVAMQSAEAGSWQSYQIVVAAAITTSLLNCLCVYKIVTEPKFGYRSAS